MGIRLKGLSKLGYRDNVACSLVVVLVNKYCKHETRERILVILDDVLGNPEIYKNNEVWNKLIRQLSPTLVEKIFTSYDLLDGPLVYRTYGSKHIETPAKQQMNLVMRPPVTLVRALVPDAHAGYGLPTGGVLTTDNVVTLCTAGVDIGCRMNFTLFDAREDFLRRYSHQMREALKESTHLGMDGGLSFVQEHEVLDREEFRMIELLRGLHGKVVRQLGSSGGRNHFVEFGRISLQVDNILGASEDNYAALLSYFGPRGLGAAIAKHYSLLARGICRSPRGAQHFAWLGLDTEEGQEYWLSMNLTGDYARACHERIYLDLAKALGLKPLVSVNNHYNFAWKEELTSGQTAIVHRRGAIPAQKGLLGLIPGSMATPGYLVCGKGVGEALCSASHGARRAISRQKVKDSFTQSALKKYLSQAGVTLTGDNAEEIPLVYKNIDRVMQTQETLVEI